MNQISERGYCEFCMLNISYPMWINLSICITCCYISLFYMLLFCLFVLYAALLLVCIIYCSFACLFYMLLFCLFVLYATLLLVCFICCSFACLFYMLLFCLFVLYAALLLVCNCIICCYFACLSKYASNQELVCLW